MRILWIARTCPYPANDGEKIRVFNLLKKLSHHEITLVFRVMRDSELQHVSELEKYCHAVHYAYIPSPKSNLTRLRWCLPFIFSHYPLSLCTVFFSEILQILRHLCLENTYDIIQVEHSALTIYLDHLTFPENTHKIVTMHNIDYIRNERILKNQPDSFYKIFNYINNRKYKTWELAALDSYDKVITVSEIDKNELLFEKPSLDIDILPNGVDTECYTIIRDNSNNNNHSLLFVASMDSDANNDAAIYFITSIFPLVKEKCPDASLYLVGRRPGTQLSEYHNNTDIFVTGEVSDVIPFYRNAAVTVVPLRSGGGTRLKILEAMAVGSPVVSTSIGCEGLNLIHGTHVLLADDPETFSSCILKLFDNTLTRNNLVSQSRKMVEAEYDWRMIAARHDSLYSEVAATA